LGASTVLAVCSDLLGVLTLHVDLLHTAFSRVYRVWVAVLASLLRLFRGMKRNPLRGRVDSFAPSTPSLLLGVLLFAVLVFLAPTVVIYYAFFSIVRVILMGAQAVLWWGMAAFNCFPVLPLLLWLIRRGALPGGVRFEVLPPPSITLQPIEGEVDEEAEEDVEEEERVRAEIMAAPEGSAYTTRYRHVLERVGVYEVRGSEKGDDRVRGIDSDYLVLVSLSVPLSSLFFQYRVALSYLQRHYTARNLAAALFQGRRLPTAPPASAGLAAAALMSEGPT